MLNEMKYVYAVYQERSFSKAAKKLYISQPALSNMVRKAEKKIGAAIFDRSTIPLTVTKEGAHYIKAIEEIMFIQRNMKAYFDFLTSNYNCKVLGGITLGRTEHEYHKTHPIEDILGTEEKPQTENKSIMDFFKDIYRC